MQFKMPWAKRENGWQATSARYTSDGSRLAGHTQACISTNTRLPRPARTEMGAVQFGEVIIAERLRQIEAGHFGAQRSVEGPNREAGAGLA